MPVKIFCCYSHQDEPLLNKLKSHLKPLQRQGLIEIWNDRDISAGTDFEKEISQQLNSAQIILLLISSDFMASDYCYGIEMQRAIERHNRGEARVIPIILRPVYRQGSPFSVLQALPLDGKPIIERSSRHGREKAFLEVTIGIKEACDQIEKRRSNYSLSVNEIWDGKDTTPYRQTVQLDTIMALVMIHKAVTLFELKRYEEALMNYSIALSYDDQCARTYFPFCDLGEAYYNLKQYLLALKAFKEALDLDPEDIVAQSGRANTLFKLKRYQEAVVALLDYSSYKRFSYEAFSRKADLAYMRVHLRHYKM